MKVNKTAFRIDWGVSRNNDVVDSGARSNDVRPPVRTTSLVRPTPQPTTTTVTTMRGAGERQVW